MKKESQENRVLKILIDADGGWVPGQYFLRTIMLSQYHRAIFNLQKRGNKIEASKFVDEHGFKSYRLILEPKNPPITFNKEKELETLKQGYLFKPKHTPKY
jgi:hypothetical protein